MATTLTATPETIAQITPGGTPSVSDYINSLYVSLYGRAADAAGYQNWITQLNSQFKTTLTADTALTTKITPDQEVFLAQSFITTQADYFNKVYGGATQADTAFVDQLYLNIGGSQETATERTFWVNELNKIRLEVASKFTDLKGTDLELAARQELVAAFTDALQTTDFADITKQIAAGNLPATTTLADGTVVNTIDLAHARQDTFVNRIRVSTAFEQATNLKIADPTKDFSNDPVFLASQRALTGVTNQTNTATSVIQQIGTANTAKDATLIGGAGIGSGSTITLTPGADTVDAIQAFLNGSLLPVPGSPHFTTGDQLVIGTDLTATAIDFLSDPSTTDKDVAQFGLAAPLAGAAILPVMTNIEETQLAFSGTSGGGVFFNAGSAGLPTVKLSGAPVAQVNLGASLNTTGTTKVDASGLTDATNGFTVNFSATLGAVARTITGGAGKDVILGGDGADTVDGGAASDRINGFAGNDSLKGGGGGDTLIGGTGGDTLQGGGGNDAVALGNSVAGAGSLASVIPAASGFAANGTLSLAGTFGATGAPAAGFGGAPVGLLISDGATDIVKLEADATTNGDDFIIGFAAGGNASGLTYVTKDLGAVDKIDASAFLGKAASVSFATAAVAPGGFTATGANVVVLTGEDATVGIGVSSTSPIITPGVAEVQQFTLTAGTDATGGTIVVDGTSIKLDGGLTIDQVGAAIAANSAAIVAKDASLASVTYDAGTDTVSLNFKGGATGNVATRAIDLANPSAVTFGAYTEVVTGAAGIAEQGTIKVTAGTDANGGSVTFLKSNIQLDGGLTVDQVGAAIVAQKALIITDDPRVADVTYNATTDNLNVIYTSTSGDITTSQAGADNPTGVTSGAVTETTAGVAEVVAAIAPTFNAEQTALSGLIGTGAAQLHLDANSKILIAVEQHQGSYGVTGVNSTGFTFDNTSGGIGAQTVGGGVEATELFYVTTNALGQASNVTHVATLVGTAAMDLTAANFI